ncbi:hypothetical protein BKA65DRAFT_476091 [Rhexocercosporidium sp. MPI-PUGE-AT-0058]|nr:hypothetical protein BKA65DRAFT_476091 [Rhexocercosporidium sp. MPI-PUGE-AT-0058]
MSSPNPSNTLVHGGTAGETAANSTTPLIVSKEPITAKTEEKPSLSASSHPESQGDAWAPSLRRNTPALGLAAAFITLGCCIGAIIIVVVSNGQNVEAWKIQPSVLLAILMAGSNATLMFALAGGITNSWWYMVYKGAPIAEVHRQWSVGVSLWEALSAGKHMGPVAVATVIGTWAIFVTDPLMQKSTNVVSVNLTSSVNVAVSIAPLIPYGYTGMTVAPGGADNDLSVVAPTVPAMDVARDYFNKVPITTGFTGCKGNCSGTIPAAGFAVTCHESRFPIDFYAIAPNASNTSDFSFQQPQLAFSTKFTENSWTLSSNLTVSYVDSINRTCAGFMTVRSCYLQAATIEYPVSIINNLVTLGDVSSPKVLAIQNSSAYSHETCLVDCPIYASGSMTISGITLSAQRLFSSSAILTHVNPTPQTAYAWKADYAGTLSNQYQSVKQSDFVYTIANCNMSYSDPTDVIIQAMNEMMFRTALRASNTSLYFGLEGFNHPGERVLFTPMPGVDGIPRNINITMTQTSSVNVYKSDYKYLGASITLILLSLILIIPLYYGYWKMGRRLTLSPLETAKAFGAPLLSKAGSNMEVGGLVKVAGSTKVRYGGVLRAEDGVQVHRLEIAEAETVQAPRRGIAYG